MQTANPERFVIVCFLASSPPARFKRSGWPLHLTVVPPFDTDVSTKSLRTILSSVADKTPAIHSKTSGRASFGRQGRKKVTLLQPTADLLALHNRLIEKLRPIAASLVSASYIENQFTPHISDSIRDGKPPNRMLTLNHISIVGLKKYDGIVINTFQLSG